MASEATGVSSLAERYAAALFELADEGKALDAVAADLVQVRGMLQESGDLVRLVRSPILSRDAQARALDAVAGKAELGALTRNFLAIVARNRRLFAVPAMIESYLAKLAALRGEVTAQVTAAQELSTAQRERLADHLRRAMGRRVTIDIAVDPALLGGMIVKLGSRMVDFSLDSKLNRLRRAMRGVP